MVINVFFFFSSHVTGYQDGTEIELGQVDTTHSWIQMTNRNLDLPSGERINVFLFV